MITNRVASLGYAKNGQSQLNYDCIFIVICIILLF